MKKQKKAIALAAKVIGGIAFLFVFILNIMLFVDKDSQSSGLSIEALQASAQPGGENDDDCPAGFTKGDGVKVPTGNWRPYEHNGEPYVCYEYVVTFTCSPAGEQCGICDSVNLEESCIPA